MAYYRYSSHNYYRPSPIGGFKFFPPVIKGLLVSNVAVFLLVTFFGMFRIGSLPLREFFTHYFGLMPLQGGFYPWQVVTYQFMHADFWHLFFNMVFGLWMFGMRVEETWGSRKFLFYYLACGVAAGLAQLFLAPILEPSSLIDQFGQPIPTVGASGAIYGVMLAFAMMFPNEHIFLYFLLPVKVKYFVAGLILLGVLSVGDPGNVANLAHLGGAALGFVYLLVDLDKIPLRKWWYEWKTASTRPSSFGNPTFRDRYRTRDGISDARHRDEQGRDDDEGVNQERIDEILDKISKHGYQSLSEEDKRILFDASKKLN